MSAKYFNDVGCGFIPGRRIVNIFGNAENVLSSDTPCTLWPLKTLYEFPTVGESWQVRSTSPHDTVGGIGAENVLIDILDPLYIQQPPLLINLAGTTPVLLPTGVNNFRVNAMNIVDSGARHTNVGDIILESSTSSAVRALILAEKGAAVAFSYTVPAGHNLWVPNFLFNMAKLGGGGGVAWKSEFRVMLPNQTILVASTASIIAGSSEITVPAGFSIGEKLTIEERIFTVSANGCDINVQCTGILTDLTDPSVVQRLPTAWTEY